MKKFNIYLKERKNKISIFGVSPVFDWRVLIGIAFVGILAGIVFATYFYMNLNNGKLLEVTEDPTQYVDFDQKKKRIDKKVAEIESRNFDEMVEN